MFTRIVLIIIVFIVCHLNIIIFCCVHCRAFIALRHKSRFALWLFNVGCKELFKARLTEQLLHGCDTKQLLFVRVKTSSFDSFRYVVFTGVSAVGTTLDQLPAGPFFTADCLLECILLDVVGPRDQFVDTGRMTSISESSNSGGNLKSCCASRRLASALARHL